MFPSDCTSGGLKADNRRFLDGFQNRGEKILLIDSDYEETLRALLDEGDEIDVE